jgi:hypothetical protein
MFIKYTTCPATQRHVRNAACPESHCCRRRRTSIRPCSSNHNLVRCWIENGSMSIRRRSPLFFSSESDSCDAYGSPPWEPGSWVVHPYVHCHLISNPSPFLLPPINWVEAMASEGPKLSIDLFVEYKEYKKATTTVRAWMACSKLWNRCGSSRNLETGKY